MTSPALYRRDAALLAGALLVILAITFAPFVFGHRSLMMAARDVPSIYTSGAQPPAQAQPFGELRALDPGAGGWQTEPWFAIQHRIVRDGRWPWWDPYDGYGQPFAAAMQPQPFYPLTALLALDPSPRGYNAWVILRFFVAGWFAALYLRLLTGRAAALIGGAATMFTGYYLVYYDMPHLSVEVGLPMLLWATELVMRRPSAPARIAALAVAAGLIYLGGMPESAILALTMAFLYGVIRVVTVRTWVQAALALIGSHLLGLLLGGVMLVPFGAYVAASFSTHDLASSGTSTGMASDPGWQNFFLTELVPRAFGWPWASILTNGSGHSGVRGFFGCAALLLALVAVITAVRRREAMMPPVLYLTVVAAFCILKRFGNPLVAWTGSLPVLRVVQFVKYDEAILGVAIAILAGFGVEAIRSRRAGLGTVATAVVLTLFTLTALMLHAIPQLPANALAAQFWQALIPAVAALLVAGIAAALLSSKADSARTRMAVLIALLVAVAGEPFFGYLQPTIWAGAPSVAANPYASVPYLSWLAAHVDRDRERIFATSGMLFPNWSGAFGFADPRSLNALYPGDYLPFVDAFVTKNPPTSDDQHDRFSGMRQILLSAPLVERWLQLSSIGYVIQNPGTELVDSPPNGILDQFWEAAEGQVLPADAPAVHLTAVAVDGVAENALFEHATHSVQATIVVPRDRPLFVADVAIQPSAYVSASCGGPVSFALDALDATGRAAGHTRVTIDPYDRPQDRHWRAVALDLSAQRGQMVDLRFSTSSVQACNAWALWGEPRFTVPSDRHTIRKRRMYFVKAFSSPDAVIYRVPNALPRLSLFHQARTANGLTAALTALTSDRFDVHTEAVVDGPVPALGAASALDRVTETAAHSDDTVAEVTTASGALLMQNDTWFPGWIARVDGVPSPLLKVDGIFRGVAVPAGRHMVEIAYESTADTIGLLSSGSALLVILGLLAVGAGKARRSTSSA